MNERKISRSGDVIAEEAADWIVALADADEDARKAFAAWLRRSPEHIKEFLAISAIWGTLPGHSAQPSAAELARLSDTQPNVVAMPGAAANGSKATIPPASSRRRWMARAAAVLVAAAAGAIFLILSPGKDPNLYTTEIGEQSSVPLQDGSLVMLNTRSAMRVAYSEEYRDVHLSDGEALFDVARESARPFRVITDQAVFQAVGTQFNVRRDSDKVTITVIEGAVDVRPLAAGPAILADGGRAESGPPGPLRLEVGQQAQVAAGVAGAAVTDTVVDHTIAWRDRDLVFEALPLKQVIEEFNRYNAPPVEIRDPKLELLPISGVFRSDDRDSFLQFLSQMRLAESSTRADGTIVLTGGEGGQARQ